MEQDNTLIIGQEIIGILSKHKLNSKDALNCIINIMNSTVRSYITKIDKQEAHDHISEIQSAMNSMFTKLHMFVHVYKSDAIPDFNESKMVH